MALVAALACLLFLPAACGPKVNNGGYVKDGDIKSQIGVGTSTRDEVLSKLGSPSSQSSFGPETWYYITDRQETIAFLKPEVVKQDVVAVTFDKSGVVSDIKNYNIADSKNVAIATRTTPTEGHTLGFFEQVLGNIGRFNSPGSGPTGITPGRQPGTGY